MFTIVDCTLYYVSCAKFRSRSATPRHRVAALRARLGRGGALVAGRWSLSHRCTVAPAPRPRRSQGGAALVATFITAFHRLSKLNCVTVTHIKLAARRRPTSMVVRMLRQQSLGAQGLGARLGAARPLLTWLGLGLGLGLGL